MCVCTCKPAYEASLADGQWAVIEPLLPQRDPRRGCRPLKFPRRLIIDTVLYVLGSGRAWRRPVEDDLRPWGRLPLRRPGQGAGLLADGFDREAPVPPERQAEVGRLSSGPLERYALGRFVQHRDDRAA